MTRGQADSSNADFAIDLGTANTLVVERRLGVVFDEPSVCCFEAFDAAPKFVAAGAEAQELVGRVSKPLKIVHPLKNGLVGSARIGDGFAASAVYSHPSGLSLVPKLEGPTFRS